MFSKKRYSRINVIIFKKKQKKQHTFLGIDLAYVGLLCLHRLMMAFYVYIAYVYSKIRRKVPLPLRKIKEELHSCKLYKCGDVTLTAYEEKVNKHVLILSTMHIDIAIADNAKKTPETVFSHNETKYGVDVLDKIGKKYTCRTGTRKRQYIVSKIH